MTDGAFLIRGAKIIDGTGRPPVRGGAVLIDGSRIGWVGPEEDAPNGSALSVIDATNYVLLPGLIDCHTHLCNDGAPAFYEQCVTDSVSTATIRAVRNCRLNLDSGVTTIRDCGASNGVAIDVAAAVAAGMLAGPRILAAGRPLTMTGGHCHFMGGEVDGTDDVRRAARTELKRGAGFVKIMATGGIQTPDILPGQVTLGVDELTAAAIEAHNADKRITAHAISAAGVKNSLRAGIDSIEHWYYIDTEAIEMGLDAGAYFVPTMLPCRRIVENATDGNIPQWVVDQTLDAAEANRESFIAGLNAGLRIATGTDAGTPYNPHGGVAGEVQLMVEYGATPMDAIRAATSVAAANLAIDDRLGTIETGKLADLLLVSGDPLEDIGSLSDVALVVKDGLVYRDRDSLGERLDQRLKPSHDESGQLLAPPDDEEALSPA